MENITLEHKFPDGNPSEVIIRTGDAEKVQEPVSAKIHGNLDSVYRWLKARSQVINNAYSHITVDRENLTINLRENENYPVGNVVTGKLELHPVYKEFGINAMKYRTTIDLAEFFKMKRSFFESHAENMKLVSELRNFKGKVDKEIEKAQGTRGDKKLLVNQVVTTNLPETFKLNMPIFKGATKHLFSVELYFNPDDLTCCMVSQDAADEIELCRSNVIDFEVENLKEFNIVIIEV